MQFSKVGWSENWADDLIYNLVGGFNPYEKYESVGMLFPIYGKIKVMFQTTNQ